MLELRYQVTQNGSLDVGVVRYQGSNDRLKALSACCFGYAPPIEVGGYPVA